MQPRCQGFLVAYELRLADGPKTLRPLRAVERARLHVDSRPNVVAAVGDIGQDLGQQPDALPRRARSVRRVAMSRAARTDSRHQSSASRFTNKSRNAEAHAIIFGTEMLGRDRRYLRGE